MDETALKDLTAQVTSLASAVEGQGRQIAELAQPKSGSPNASAVFGASHVRSGEDPMTSRGWSLLRMFARMFKAIPDEQCKVEADVHNKLHKVLCQGMGYQKAETNSWMVPFAMDHLSTTDGVDFKLVNEIKALVRAGAQGYDPQEVFSLRAKHWGVEKALSWIDDTAGGALVAPPQMGELITLLRNNAALMQAGARNIPMPPQGRAVWPRHTGASTAYWVGQSQTITDSQQATGDVTLTAKKLAVLTKIPNELFRFASIAAEQFVREDMMQVMGLKMDKSMLEAEGSAVEPKGLLNYSGITSHTAATVATDGNTLTPEDVADMIGKVEEQNAEFKAFLMRPLMYSKIANRRADAVTAGDAKGPFLFNVWRNLTDNQSRGRGVGNLEGYPVVKSTNIGNTRTKGTSTNLTYVLGGDFADLIIATAAVIEFVVANQGDTMVTTDQTWVRAVMYCDSTVAREASFVKCDQLYVA